ncbi:acyltransferase family protein [Streptomyces sp. AV19]|uniref:acyltransferase family protein n=1 Tax=Streptomyces sp. AV19 TaxID=2793068 RepID=UPI0018FE2076|nr:acyltransferase family protein [Streptomyces sp. AV19]MBH1933089.1 acyltransferase family protein [Streptomyces sp. AV19]MDG4531801.1 acyltransferase family protein [Streptomyces sp. AV19]
MPPTATSPARSVASVPPQPGPGVPKARDPFFDNAKYLAIVLVVLGHAWEPLTHSSRAATALYLTVYTFHMPAFVLISGYFSRGFDLSPPKLKRLITSVLVPYLVFQLAYVEFQHLFDEGSEPDPFTLLEPWYLNWFLAALFVWRLTTPIWRTIRWPVPVAFAIAVMATVTREVGSEFDVMRVMQFLPFFVIGLQLEPRHFALLRRRWVRIAAVPLFTCAVATAYWLAPRLDSGWFYRNSSVQDLGEPLWTGPVMVLALSLCALALTAGFLAWVPRRRTWFTVLGTGTMYGFLLHGFVIKISRWREWYDLYAWIRGPLGEVLVSVLAVALVTVLCTAPVRRVFRCVVEPRMDWAFRGPAPAATGAAGSASAARSTTPAEAAGPARPDA